MAAEIGDGPGGRHHPWPRRLISRAWPLVWLGRNNGCVENRVHHKKIITSWTFQLCFAKYNLFLGEYSLL
jgi:hypothetical protein